MPPLLLTLATAGFWLCGSLRVSPSHPLIRDATGVESRKLAIQAVITGGGAADHRQLVDLLCKYGLYSMDAETMDLVRANIAPLESCLVAAATAGSALDWSLHRELVSFASDSAKSAVCADLRQRLLLPRYSPALENWASSTMADRETIRPIMMQLLKHADLLAAYRDRLAKPLLRSLIDALDSTAADTVWAVTNEGRATWYLRNAIHRIDAPDYGAILSFGDDGASHVVRRAGELASVCFQGRDGWQSLDCSKEKAYALLTGLRSPKPDSGPDSTDKSYHFATLRLTFSDGFSAFLFFSSTGWVWYWDNVKYDSGKYKSVDPRLASEFLDLIERARETSNHG